jgi:hypothetical protein
MSARQAKLWVMIPWPEDEYDRSSGAKIYYWVWRCPKLSVWPSTRRRAWRALLKMRIANSVESEAANTAPPDACASVAQCSLGQGRFAPAPPVTASGHP